MSQTKITNYHKTFKGLTTGIISLSSIILGLVLVSAIVVLALVIPGQHTPQNVSAAVLSIMIIEGVCNVALITLIFVSIALVAKLSGKLTSKGVVNYRITFSILIGFFVLFWILTLILNGVGNYYSIFAFFQLIVILLMLIFACIYRNKISK